MVVFTSKCSAQCSGFCYVALVLLPIFAVPYLPCVHLPLTVFGKLCGLSLSPLLLFVPTPPYFLLPSTGSTLLG